MSLAMSAALVTGTLVVVLSSGPAHAASAVFLDLGPEPAAAAVGFPFELTASAWDGAGTPLAGLPIRVSFVSGPNDPGGPGNNPDLTCITGPAGGCVVAYTPVAPGTDVLCAVSTGGPFQCTEPIDEPDGDDNVDVIEVVVTAGGPTPTPDPTPSLGPTPTPTPDPTPTPEATPTPSPDPTPTPEPTATPSPDPTPTPSPDPTPTPEPTATPTPSPTPMPSPDPTRPPPPRPTARPTREPKGTASPAATPAPTAAHTSIPDQAPAPTPASTPSPDRLASPALAPSADPSVAPITAAIVDRIPPAAGSEPATVPPESRTNAGSGTPGEGPGDLLGAVLSAVDQVTETVKPAAIAAVATAFTFPLALAVVVIIFLLVQARLDGRDPKLRHAPTSAGETYIAFEEEA
jgi:hypothetical protein